MGDRGDDRKPEEGEDATKPNEFEKEDGDATALVEEAPFRHDALGDLIWFYTT